MNEGFANFIGKDGFNWWVGQVENDGGKFWNAELKDGEGDFDYSDTDWTNKVKVRIIGYHNPNRKELPTTDLPWAQVLMPAIYGMRSGIGSIQQLQINSWVVGFFMDGASSQIPIVMGSIADENPITAYEAKGGSEFGYAQLQSPKYRERDHGKNGSGSPNTANTVEVDANTGHDKKAENNEGHTNEEGTTSTKNERGPAKEEADKQAVATEKQKEIDKN